MKSKVCLKYHERKILINEAMELIYKGKKKDEIIETLKKNHDFPFTEFNVYRCYLDAMTNVNNIEEKKMQDKKEHVSVRHHLLDIYPIEEGLNDLAEIARDKGLSTLERRGAIKEIAELTSWKDLIKKEIGVSESDVTDFKIEIVRNYSDEKK